MGSSGEVGIAWAVPFSKLRSPGGEAVAGTRKEKAYLDHCVHALPLGMLSRKW